MKKKSSAAPPQESYSTRATPKAQSPDGALVFCAHDAIIPVQDAVPNPRNPNQHSKQQVALLAKIIQATGWRTATTISKRSGLIVKGHARRLAAIHMGATHMPVDYQDYTSEAEEWADLIADNRLAELASVDTPMLLDLIGDLDTGELPVELTGYTQEDLAEIIAAMEGADDSVDDQADAVPETPLIVMTRPGDIWNLGQHRLACGSATDKETVTRLMAGEKAHMINTDPPYGVSYTAQSGKFKPIENDGLRRDDLMARLLVPAFRHMVEASEGGAAFYIWHASSTRRDFEDAMTAAGLVEKQQIIWVKPSPVLGRADYHWAHEPCFYAEKAGQSAAFYGDRTQTTQWKAVLRGADNTATVLTGGVVLTDGAGGKAYLNDKPPKGKKVRYIRLTSGRSIYLYSGGGSKTTWEVSREVGAEHPTQKPVELAIRAIDNSSRPGDIVADFFAGSGSTLIGAEMAGRRCYAIELDPAYCDVIVNRYVRFTGRAAVTCQRGGKVLKYADLQAESEQASAAAR